MATWIDITERSAVEWIVLTAAIRVRQKEQVDASDLVTERAMVEQRIITLSAPIDRYQARVISDNRAASAGGLYQYRRRGL